MWNYIFITLRNKVYYIDKIFIYIISAEIIENERGDNVLNFDLQCDYLSIAIFFFGQISIAIISLNYSYFNLFDFTTCDRRRLFNFNFGSWYPYVIANKIILILLIC